MRKRIKYGVIARAMSRMVIAGGNSCGLRHSRYQSAKRLGVYMAVDYLTAIIDTETARKPQPSVHALIQHLHDQGHCLPHLATSPSERVPDPVLHLYIQWCHNLAHCDNHPITFHSYHHAWDYLRYLLNLMLIEQRPPQTILKLLCGWVQVVQHATYLSGEPTVRWGLDLSQTLLVQMYRLHDGADVLSLYPLVTPATTDTGVGLMRYGCDAHRKVMAQLNNELLICRTGEEVVRLVLETINPVDHSRDGVIENLRDIVQATYLASGYTLTTHESEALCQ